MGRNRKAWGVSPRNPRACNFSKPQRGRHRIVPAPRREPIHVTPLGLKTKRATSVSLAPGSWGSRTRLYDNAASRLVSADCAAA